MNYITENRAKLIYMLPLAEVWKHYCDQKHVNFPPHCNLSNGIVCIFLKLGSPRPLHRKGAYCHLFHYCIVCGIVCMKQWKEKLWEAMRFIHLCVCITYKALSKVEFQ
jgi:hypothetical protein